jgi:hypothetical protein
MPIFWEPLAVMVMFSPPTLVVTAVLQWLLRHRISNTTWRLLGSWAVVGAVFNAAFFWLMSQLTF